MKLDDILKLVNAGFTRDEIMSLAPQETQKAQKAQETQETHKAQETQETHKAQETQETHKAQETQETHKAQETKETPALSGMFDYNSFANALIHAAQASNVASASTGWDPHAQSVDDVLKGFLASYGKEV